MAYQCQSTGNGRVSTGAEWQGLERRFALAQPIRIKCFVAAPAETGAVDSHAPLLRRLCCVAVGHIRVCL